MQDNWRNWSTDRPIPLTTTFDPDHDAALLPWTMLADIEWQQNAFRAYDLRARFVGSAVSQYFAVDGQRTPLMSEIGQPFAERWFEVADRTLAARSCLCFSGAPYQTGFDFANLEMSVLPFTTDGVTIDSLLVAFAMSLFKR